MIHLHFARFYAILLLKPFGKIRRCGEAYLIGNFGDIHISGLKQMFCFCQSGLTKKVNNRVAGKSLHLALQLHTA